MSQYQYVKSANLEILESEIRSSNIITALDALTGLGTTITITFKATLSNTDETTLSTIVNNHVNIPSPEEAQLVKIDQPEDSDGALVIRQKAAKTGWKAQFQAIRITTSTVDGVHNKDKSGNNLGFCAYTMYDSQNQVTAIIADCVKTVVTWEVSYDIEIVGGRLFQKTAPNTDMWLYVTAAAHIPAQYGGSIAFLEGGMNLMDVADGGEVDFDGRASKFIAYDSVNHSGRFEMLLKHNAGVQHSFSLVFELFRP